MIEIADKNVMWPPLLRYYVEEGEECLTPFNFSFKATQNVH